MKRRQCIYIKIKRDICDTNDKDGNVIFRYPVSKKGCIDEKEKDIRIITDIKEKQN